MSDQELAVQAVIEAQRILPDGHARSDVLAVAGRISAQNPTRRRRAGAITLARDTLQETPLAIRPKRTPAPIMPSARAAVTDTSMILPRINGPRSLTRHCIERPDRVLTVMPGSMSTSHLATATPVE
jgi:hypothetical protein